MDGPSIPQTKRCAHCKELLPVTDFCKRRRSPDGLNYYCRECERQLKGSKMRRKKFPPAPEGYKWCSACETAKPLDQFHKNAGRRDGRSTICMTCAKTRAMDWHWNNREKHLEAMRQFREKKPDVIREYRRRDQERHPGRDKEAQKRFRQERPEQYKARRKREYEKHKSKIMKRAHEWRKETAKGRASRKAEHSRRRAHRLAAEGSYTGKDLVAQFKRQKGKCYWCGEKMDPNRYEPDHVLPLSRFHDNSISNIVCVHPHCNHSKSDKLPHEWEGSGGKLL